MSGFRKSWICQESAGFEGWAMAAQGPGVSPAPPPRGRWARPRDLLGPHSESEAPFGQRDSRWRGCCPTGRQGPRSLANARLRVHRAPGPGPGGNAESTGAGRGPETWLARAAARPQASPAGRERGDGHRVGFLPAPGTEGDADHTSHSSASPTLASGTAGVTRP